MAMMMVASAIATQRARASSTSSSRSNCFIEASAQRDHRLDDGGIDPLALRFPDCFADLLPLRFLGSARHVDVHLGVLQLLLEGDLAFAVDLIALVAGVGVDRCLFQSSR